MKKLVMFFALFSAFILTSCDKSDDDLVDQNELSTTTDNPEDSIQNEPARSLDEEGIQQELPEPNDDETIIVPPPEVEMPPEILPDPAYETPED